MAAFLLKMFPNISKILDLFTTILSTSNELGAEEIIITFTFKKEITTNAFSEKKIFVQTKWN